MIFDIIMIIIVIMIIATIVNIMIIIIIITVSLYPDSQGHACLVLRLLQLRARDKQIAGRRCGRGHGVVAVVKSSSTMQRSGIRSMLPHPTSQRKGNLDLWRSCRI